MVSSVNYDKFCNDKIYKNFLFYMAFCLLFLQFFGREFISTQFRFIDEIVLFFIILFSFFYIFKKKKYIGLCLSLFVFSGLFLSLWEFRFNAIVFDMSWFIKSLFYFWGCYYLFELLPNIDRKSRFVNKIVVLCVMYGLCQFFAWYLFRYQLPLSGEKYVMGFSEILAERFTVRRVSSVFGHTLWFGYISSLFGSYFFYKRKYFLAIFCFLGVFVTFSRWALVLSVLSITSILSERKQLKTKIALISLLCIVTIFAIINYQKIANVYNIFWGTYSKNAIKITGIKKASTLFFKNPIGYGFGTFGTSNSIGSSLYKELNWNISSLSTSGIESFYTILLVQTGIIGLFLYVMPFLIEFKKYKQTRFVYLHLLVLPIMSVLYIPLYLFLSSFLIVSIKKNVNYDKDRLNE